MKKQLAATYLDWFNNFLTLERFAEYHDISEKQAQALIDLGQSIHEQEVRDNLRKGLTPKYLSC